MSTATSIPRAGSPTRDGGEKSSACSRQAPFPPGRSGHVRALHRAAGAFVVNPAGRRPR